MVGPIITGLIFSSIIIALSIIKPNACRICLGVFFIVMGVGVNLSFIITQPFFVYEYGMSSWLPLCRTLTENIIGLNPRLFGVLLILFEFAVGFLMLTNGRKVKIGIIGAALFVLLLIVINFYQLFWAISSVGIFLLLRRDYPKHLLEVLKENKNKRVKV